MKEPPQPVTERRGDPDHQVKGAYQGQDQDEPVADIRRTFILDIPADHDRHGEKQDPEGDDDLGKKDHTQS